MLPYITFEVSASSTGKNAVQNINKSISLFLHGLLGFLGVDTEDFQVITNQAAILPCRAHALP